MRQSLAAGASPLAPGLAGRRCAEALRRFSWIGLAAILVTALALLPLGFVLWASVETGWAAVSALVFRPRVGELLLNTGLLVLIAVPLSGLLALALAWLTERSDLPLARLWAWLAIAPLAVPAFVQSYAWVSLVPDLHGLAGGVLVSVLAYFPFFYLPLAATLRRLDPGLEDAAASLGHAPGRVFLRVVLPQLRVAAAGGALLVALHLLGEYGLFAMIRFDTFTTAIVDQFQSSFDGVAGNMLALVLVACCLGLLGLEGLLRGGERLARVGAGASRPPPRARLGRLALPCMALPLLTAALSLGVPFVTIAGWLEAGGAGIWRMGEILPTLGQTLALALAGGALTVAAAVPMAWLSIRAKGRTPRLLESCNYLVGAMPSVVVALALVSVTVHALLPLYQTVFTVLAAYAIMFLPRAIVGLRASIAQAPPELEQAAASLGRRPVAALWATTVRLAAPGAAAGMALVSLGVVNELTATQMLAPNGTRTLAMQFWVLSGELDYAAAAPYALAMVVLSLPLTWLLFARPEESAKR